MGMMSRILSPLAPAAVAPAGILDRLLEPASGRKCSEMKRGQFRITAVCQGLKVADTEESDEVLSRIRQGYLHSLGIRRGQAARSATTGPVSEPAVEEVHASEQPHEEDDAFRVNFLRKLSYSKVWVPVAQRPPKSQTAIIFDWDDTLLCTSYLSLFNNRPLPAQASTQLIEIARSAKFLLELAMRCGQTFIITNAMCGWVEYSAAKWVPELLPTLQKVHILSARSKYEPHFPDVHQWKIQAFLEVQQQLDSEVVTNLLSVGDSDFEMEAVHIMGSKFAEALVKTVKFRENPNPEDLRKELLLVSAKFERIVEAGRHLKVCLDRRPVNTHEG